MWQARQILTEIGAPNIPLIAKIERPEALDHLEDILKVSQGVMVARGDLGLEMPLERVPTRRRKSRGRRGAPAFRYRRDPGARVDAPRAAADARRGERRGQRRRRRRRCHHVGGGDRRRPLSGKNGRDLDAVIREAERIGPSNTGAIGIVTPIIEVPRAPHVLALAEAAVTLADHCNAFAIVAITRLGNAARVLSALRPRTPIFASTETEVIARQLTLYRGVTPMTTGIGKDADTTGTLLKQELSTRGLVPSRLGGGVHQRERPPRARRSEFSEFAEIRVSRPEGRHYAGAAPSRPEGRH